MMNWSDKFGAEKTFWHEAEPVGMVVNILHSLIPVQQMWVMPKYQMRFVEEKPQEMLLAMKLAKAS